MENKFRIQGNFFFGNEQLWYYIVKEHGNIIDHRPGGK